MDIGQDRIWFTYTPALQIKLTNLWFGTDKYVQDKNKIKYLWWTIIQKNIYFMSVYSSIDYPCFAIL